MIGSARRVLILGLPGSGKSTLARRLAREHGLPHLEVDTFYWQNRKGGAIAGNFPGRLAELLKDESWIVEGHYRKVESMLPTLDLILVLRPAWPTLLLRTAWRDLREFAQGRRVTSDLAWLARHRGRYPSFDPAELARRWDAPVIEV